MVFHRQQGGIKMIDMLSTVKEEFPEIYTKAGKLRKQEPKRFLCSCGHAFNKTKNTRVGGFVFGSPICEKCGNRAKEAKSYSVWKRMIDGQIEIEDFILNVVTEHPSIEKEELMKKVEDAFPKHHANALGHLVYFGYLEVDKEKRDTMNRVEYTINPNKNLSKRYERIQ